MNKLCRQYRSDIKSFFPIMGNPEKKYLFKLMRSVEDYCDEEHVTTIEELYTGFGSPRDVVSTYLENADASFITKRIRVTKWVKRGIFTFLTIALIGVSIFGIVTYNQYITFMQEQINFDEAENGSLQ